MKNKEVFTKEQRHEIYKEARKLIIESNADYICQALYYAMQNKYRHILNSKYRDSYHGWALECSPEIKKLKPASIIDSECSWWKCDKLGFKMRIWMLDTAIEQTKEIKPERVSNPIRTFKDLKIEVYKLALELQKIDKEPYAMCPQLAMAIEYVFKLDSTNLDEFLKKYFPEFLALKPKDLSNKSFWFGVFDNEIRIKHFEKLIKDLEDANNTY